jgi:hypothetical protein
MRGARKKTKAHKSTLEYMIIEDDADIVVQMIQDRTIEDFNNVVCQRDIMEEEMGHIRQLLKQLRYVQVTDNNLGMVPSASQIGIEEGSSE